MKKITLKSTFLPVRSKRNAFANRVGQHASIMRNQYYVNVASRWNHLCHEKEEYEITETQTIWKKNTMTATSATLHKPTTP